MLDPGAPPASGHDPDQLLEALRLTIARHDLALGAARMGTWQWEAATGEVRWSAGLEAIYGLAPGTFPGTFEAYAARIHPEDRDGAVAAIERAMADRARFTYGYRIVLPDGTVRWLEGAGIPVVAADGTLEALTGVCVEATGRHDVEQQLRRERDLVASLYRVGAALTSRLDLDEVVQLVTDSATALTGAAWGAFFYNVIDERGAAYQLFTISGAPRERFEGFAKPRNTAVFQPTFAGVGTTRSADVTAEPDFGRNAPHHGLPGGHLPVRSYLATPVVLADGEVAGGLLFGHPEVGRFTEDDERLVEGIATQAAIAIDNARRYDREHRAARTLQASLLPDELPELDGLEVAALHRPGVDGTDVGGDWYDVVPVDDDRTLLVVGDVAGRGIAAAALTGALRHSIRAHALDGDRPAAILGKLHRALGPRRDGQFATVWCGLHDRRRHQLEVASAGHLPAVLSTPARPAQLVHAPVGVPVGVSAEADYHHATVPFPAGARLLVYTDGLVERRDEPLDTGLGRLLAATGATADLPVGDQLDAVLAQLDPGSCDDVALLGLHRPA